jgi:hypothetical protein
MRNFIEYITEAPKAPKPAAIEAERLRKEAIEAFKKALKTPKLTKVTIAALKRGLKQLSSLDYADPALRYADFKAIHKNLKNDIKDIKRLLDMDAYHRKSEERERKILDNPYTICDLLSDPKPNKFIDLIKSGAPDVDARAKWIDELDKVHQAFGDWFEAQGGRKKEMIKIFNQMVACKNRAPWAAWSGKGYRGVTRTTAVVSKYNFTGEIKKIGKSEWLVAKGTYKSRYDAQSWSDEWRTAEQFSDSNLSDIAKPIGVVFEVDLKKNETLLSADVIRQISIYGKASGEMKEREVIRVSNAPIPVTIYVGARSISNIIFDNRPIEKFGNLPKPQKFREKSRKYVYDRAVGIIGVKGADAFGKTKAFEKLVKDFE